MPERSLGQRLESAAHVETGKLRRDDKQRDGSRSRKLHGTGRTLKLFSEATETTRSCMK
jgi:hypothetical protein